ncbi:hypothetical protein ACFQY0_05075 [Haloferula chungangensis]|uniref:Uncharacterized protein n=1 Tax=Haloferula chungangensis TaxID=1048331 RepID=A0ABW2L4W9_9BACT
MKTLPMLATSLLVLAIIVGFGIRASERPEPSISEPLERPSRPSVSPPFWKSAEVSDPGREIPVRIIQAEDLGALPPAADTDHVALLTQAIEGMDRAAIQSAALAWYRHDPQATRDWLAAQPSLDDLQPAISYIVHEISENGDLDAAIEWSALIDEGPAREDTIFEIHALALRNGLITKDQIKLELIAPSRRAELLSGAAGD